MAEDRPPIPKGIKREVRQRCGFGCVICGSPIYDYEHMLEWSKVQRHVASEITLLCPEHHRAKTSKRMPASEVEKANKNPFNLSRQLTPSDILYYSGEEAIVKMGRTEFVITDEGEGFHFEAIKIHDFPLIEIDLQDNHFLLSMSLFDKNNNIILIVKENALQYSVGVWDIKYIGRRITINNASKDIFIDIIFETPNIINIERGKFYYKGNSFEISKDGLKINHSVHDFTLKNVTIVNVKTGIWLN